MTHSWIYASETYKDPVILLDTKDPPEVSQELNPKKEATFINQPSNPLNILLVLLVVGLSKVL